jgi:hypothetical protein
MDKERMKEFQDFANFANANQIARNTRKIAKELVLAREAREFEERKAIEEENSKRRAELVEIHIFLMSDPAYAVAYNKKIKSLRALTFKKIFISPVCLLLPILAVKILAFLDASFFTTAWVFLVIATLTLTILAYYYYFFIHQSDLIDLTFEQDFENAKLDIKHRKTQEHQKNEIVKPPTIIPPKHTIVTFEDSPIKVIKKKRLEVTPLDKANMSKFKLENNWVNRPV